jgi:phosphatidylserine/phosphatidylglycerophosphate/cardiolipin synthase-like enzyme
MFRVFSSGLWQRVRNAASAVPQRQVAIAFVTADLIGFKRGDLLITDASEAVIRSGATDAKLLLKLHRKGVTVRSCPNLHAKVLLLGDVAVVGSNNLSASSRDRLVEAALLTDAPSAVSGVAALIEQLRRQSEELDATALRQLTRIKVVRRGFIPGQPSSRKRRPRVAQSGDTTWLTGVYETDREQPRPIKQMIEHTSRKLARKHKLKTDEVEWIHWAGAGPFTKHGKPGDSVIQIWRRSPKDKPSRVFKAVPILDRRKEGGKLFVFVGQAGGRNASLPWGRFSQLLRRVGGPNRIGANTERALSSSVVELLTQQWASAR